MQRLDHYVVLVFLFLFVWPISVLALRRIPSTRLLSNKRQGIIPWARAENGGREAAACGSEGGERGAEKQQVRKGRLAGGWLGLL